MTRVFGGEARLPVFVNSLRRLFAFPFDIAKRLDRDEKSQKEKRVTHGRSFGWSVDG